MKRSKKIVVWAKQSAISLNTMLASVIATASEAGINVFDYFTTLQQESAQVKAHPENYLPWSYITKS
jgi:transposase